MQKIAVPGAVAKDVQLFMSWVPSQRRAQAKSESRSAPASLDKDLPAAPANSGETETKDLPEPPAS